MTYFLDLNLNVVVDHLLNSKDSLFKNIKALHNVVSLHCYDLDDL